MNVQPLVGTTGFPSSDGESGELVPFDFMVSGLAVGEDPTSHPLIPIPLQTEITIGELKYRCDSVGVAEVYSDNACLVRARFSTDGRFRFPARTPDTPNFRVWDFGYKKTKIVLTQFIKGVRTYANASGQQVTADWWYRYDKDFDVEFRTLNVKVTLTNISNEAVMDVVNLCDAQLGHLHQFAGRRWVMQPATIRQPRPRELGIDYAWVSDPGNGGLGQPAGVAPSDYVYVPSRPPFHVYDVIPTQTIGGRPDVTVTSLFPQTLPSGGANPFYDLNGWQNLPGTPI